ncbi:MAG TPA: Gfo/Idh/MocA family oxidoreductase [Labilithrix sp.]|nr:Gfo/Idh/MocA family oxidoreductase [Labilithrix sp.]
MGNKIRVVLFGIGRMGRNHLRLTSESADFELVGVVDSGTSVRPKGVPFFQDLAGLRARMADGSLDFDAAIVATPTATHRDVVLELVKMRKHVLVEKPIASTFAQGREVIEAAAAAGVKVAVGHVERFNPVVRKLREVIRGGWLGDPIHFSFTRVGGYPETILEGNNVLLDLAVHDIDAFRSLVGKVRVEASMAHSSFRPGVLDTAEIVLESAAGPTASVHVNWVTPTKIRSLRVTGTRGVCFMDYILQSCELYGGNLTKRIEPAGVESFESIQEHYRTTDRVIFGVTKEEPLLIQLNQFAKYLREGDAGELCLGEDALAAVLVAERAMQAAARKTERPPPMSGPTPVALEATWL